MYGLKYAKNLDPAAGRAQVLRATYKKGRQHFVEKSASSQLLSPSVKSWLRTWPVLTSLLGL